MPNTSESLTPSSPAHTLRLILGDQLNPLHSWFTTVQPEVVYVLMEIRQETDYVLHHAQKIIAIFAGMRDLARQLRETGHRVHYLAIDDPANRQNLGDNLRALIDQYHPQVFEYQDPDEYQHAGATDKYGNANQDPNEDQYTGATDEYSNGNAYPDSADEHRHCDEYAGTNRDGNA